MIVVAATPRWRRCHLPLAAPLPLTSTCSPRMALDASWPLVPARMARKRGRSRLETRPGGPAEIPRPAVPRLGYRMPPSRLTVSAAATTRSKDGFPERGTRQSDEVMTRQRRPRVGMQAAFHVV